MKSHLRISLVLFILLTGACRLPAQSFSWLHMGLPSDSIVGLSGASYGSVIDPNGNLYVLFAGWHPYVLDDVEYAAGPGIVSFTRAGEIRWIDHYKPNERSFGSDTRLVVNRVKGLVGVMTYDGMQWYDYDGNSRPVERPTDSAGTVYLNDVEVAADGSVYMFGSVIDERDRQLSGSVYIGSKIIKFDSDGTVEWESLQQGLQPALMGAVDDQGNVYVFHGSNSVAEGKRSLVKYDEAGLVLWEIDGDSTIAAFDMSLVGNNELVLVLKPYPAATFGDSGLGGGTRSLYAFCRIDAEGHFTAPIRRVRSNNMQLHGMSFDPSGIYFTGWLGDTDTVEYDGLRIPTTFGYNMFWHLDNDLSLKYATISTSKVAVTSIASDGTSTFLSGMARPGDNFGGAGIDLKQFALFYGKLESTPTSVAVHERLPQGALQVSPNPFSTAIRVAGDMRISRLVIYDALGKEVYRESGLQLGSETSIESSFLRSGTYYLSATGGDGSVNIVPIVKQ